MSLLPREVLYLTEERPQDNPCGGQTRRRRFDR